MLVSNLSSLDPNLVCGVCNRPWDPKDALSCPHAGCNSIFCAECIQDCHAKQSQCPTCKLETQLDQYVAPHRTIRAISDSSVLYFCKHKPSGCAFEGPRDGLVTHEASCAFSGKKTYDYVVPDGGVAPELLCPICQDPLENPFTTPCDHLFCKVCIDTTILKGRSSCPACSTAISEGALREAPNYVRKMLTNIVVRCKMQCGWQGERSTFVAHMSSCPKLKPLREGSAKSVQLKKDATLTVTVKNEMPTVTPCNAGKEFTTMVHINAPTVESDTSRKKPVRISAVIDVSGSMKGEKLELAKESLRFMCNELSDQDEFGIIAFDDKVTEPLTIRAMNADGKSSALAAIGSLQDRGSTNLSGGLFRGIRQIRRDAVIGGPEQKGSSMWGTPQKQQQRVSLRQKASIVDELFPLPTSTTAPPTNSTLRPLSDYSNAVMLFTDGAANCGITDPSQLVQETKRVLEGESESNVVVFTFGFGTGHNATLLQQIAEASQGSYYFIEKTEAMKEVFADCLGGLLSVAAQRLVLQCRADPRCEIVRLMTTLPTERKENGVYEVRMKDIYSEENRDILALVKITTAVSIGDMQPLVQWTLTFENALRDNALETVELQAAVQCVAEAYTGALEVDVDEQRNRVIVAEALVQARKEAEAGNFKAASDVIAKTESLVKGSTSAQSAQCFMMQHQLMKAKASSTSASAWNHGGAQMMNAYASSNIQQRSNNYHDEMDDAMDQMVDCYTTSSKCAMKSKAMKK